MRFRADAERLTSLASELSSEKRRESVYGEWTVRDILAHIAAWDWALVEGVDELLAGQRPAFVQYATRTGEAEFNARAVEEARSVTFDEILAHLRSVHETLLARLESLTDDEWGRSSPYRWGNGTPMTVASLFDYSYKGETHYGGHAGELEAWLERER